MDPDKPPRCEPQHSPPDPKWEMWIDVGGTFTDCLGRSPTGRLSRHKLLSSGVTQGTPHSASTGKTLRDPGRKNDPPKFWIDFQCTLYNAAGQPLLISAVVDFDFQSGSLQLADALPACGAAYYQLTCPLDAPAIGIRYLLGLPLARQVPPLRLRLGTTRGTNALLTRTGARTALATTAGLGDILEIGHQDRPRLFDLAIQKPEPLAETVIEIDARVGADGALLRDLDVAEARDRLGSLQQAGMEALAICLLHADRYPAHEKLLAEIARDVGFQHVSVSHQIAPLPKLVSRAETTVVDAYLNPILGSYVERLQTALPGSSLRLMTSAGGLVTAADFHGHQSILSGPAGGVVGFSQAALSAGYRRAIGLDMGGTSTDVARFDADKFGGGYELDYESHKAGVRLLSPTLAIDTVAAGGGSVCHFDGTKLCVGPASAGADPGPACYGRGGPLTITDLNFYLGRIATEYFPFSLDASATERKLVELQTQVDHSLDQQLSLLELAEGLLAIANANMVRAVRGVSVAKGENPADYTLVAFGGAGGQHACAVARELGIHTVLCHPDAGILSAYGIGHATIARHAATSIECPSDKITAAALDAIFTRLAIEPRQAVLAEGIPAPQLQERRTVDLRYVGTDVVLPITYTHYDELLPDFAEEHQRHYGYVNAERPVELVTARVEVVGRAASPSSQPAAAETLRETDTVQTVFAGERRATPLYTRAALVPGQQLAGPAIVAEPHATIVVEPGWQLKRLVGGDILLTDQGDSPPTRSAAQAAPAVALELFNNLFAGIAQQMGYVLQRTAVSVNVKQRLDYSCALFTAQGELVANAPHVPVHLGAMSMAVQSVRVQYPQLEPGDVIVSNDPYSGGSHLPDVTVVTPVFHPDTRQLLFFTACRAHHAEIGGVRPGSMPPNSRSLAEEGVLISNFALVRAGRSYEPELRRLLAEAPYPSRQVDENLADIRAQIAANQQGARELTELVQRYSAEAVIANMQGIQQAATTKVRQALTSVGRSRTQQELAPRAGQEIRRFTDYLETATGTSVPITVALTLPAGDGLPAAIWDFTGTAPAVAGNLNANASIVQAAVLYVLRLLVDEDIPLNEGALRAVKIVLPTCLLNPQAGKTPAQTPAVAAGNVETSQRVVDVLLGALGIAAASQGTMNNLLFGNDQFGYYETIGGGSGATADRPGASAVQVHMTNTRATDPEILERRQPVRLWEFSIRRGSGGAGRQPGGDGVIRRLEFLAPLEVSLITSRRGPHAPYGAAGGSPGLVGENWLLPVDAPRRKLAAICEVSVRPGDVLEIRTPGGGGYGAKHQLEHQIVKANHALLSAEHMQS